MLITIKCAWCGRYLGKKDGKGKSGVSHGICPECQKDFIKKDTLDLQREKEVDK